MSSDPTVGSRARIMCTDGRVRVGPVVRVEADGRVEIEIGLGRFSGQYHGAPRAGPSGFVEMNSADNDGQGFEVIGRSAK